MLPGIADLSGQDGPKRRFDGEQAGKKILLRCTGGLGDVLMAIGSVAHALWDSSVTACVRDHQMALTSFLTGVDNVYPSKAANNTEFIYQFDYFIDFVGVFNNKFFLIKKDYYSAIGEFCGFSVLPGMFDFEVYGSGSRDDSIFIHPNASNPNRVWPKERWGKVALSLRDAGFKVYWLGCKDEYGFSSANIFNLSDYSEDLVYQCLELSRGGYFLGGDSGFAHVAGLLHICGNVLFSATHPRDVIYHYPSLGGVHKFEDHDSPTRSLSVSDSKSLEYLDKISVGDILSIFDVPESSSEPPTMEAAGPVGLFGDYDGMSTELKEILVFVEDVYDIISVDSEKQDFPVILQEGGVTYVVKNGKKFQITVAHYSGFLRALRELR